MQTYDKFETIEKWYKHRLHGHMLRVTYKDKETGVVEPYATVVTALLLEMAETEKSKEMWEAVKSRLRVNAGSGAIAVSEMLINDRNREYRPISVNRVPEHIQHDFREHVCS